MALVDLARVGVFRYVAGLLSRNHSPDYVKDKLRERYGGSQTANTIKAVFERGRQAFESARKLFAGTGGQLRISDIPQRDAKQPVISYTFAVRYHPPGQQYERGPLITVTSSTLYTRFSDIEPLVEEAFWRHVESRQNRTRYPGVRKAEILGINPVSIER